jgi:hypothetical protein
MVGRMALHVQPSTVTIVTAVEIKMLLIGSLRASTGTWVYSRSFIEVEEVTGQPPFFWSVEVVYTEVVNSLPLCCLHWLVFVPRRSSGQAQAGYLSSSIKEVMLWNGQNICKYRIF